MRKLAALAFVALLATVSGSSAQQAYPDKNVTILVPFAPGGIVDIAARIVGEGLAQLWGKQVIVENRSGGSGFIAATAAARAAPDGYTLLAAEAGVSVINQLIFASTPYDMAKDFIPITLMSDTPIVVAVNTKSGINSMADLIAKAKTEQLNYASPANGTLNHLTGEWIALEADLKLRHIGYRGGAPAATALAGGEVPIGILAYSSIRPYVEAGNVKLLAVTGAERVEAAKDLPTLAESGVPNVATTQWAGLFAPAGTPDAIVQKIQADIATVLAKPEIQKQFAAGGASVIQGSSAEFAKRLENERKQFGEIVTKAKITAN
ncbi:tripartite-type tricarboxylate transporter receptor subunit TctC [Rhodoligotrophos appendicifer]|uniref:Bug family tripartite tricarboxylate transporter substrate binding protein n=1 Tax=Rhodoligotrophos appendicifer TaxID=987056 RepID=UPI00147825E5|nr:tripartite tricarboxylate transporter substrate binding protein [Rhodoligotrophos appendicifer]